MMDLILQFAQWKPARLSKESQVRNGREIYERIIAMISDYKYSLTHTARTTAGADSAGETLHPPKNRTLKTPINTLTP